MNMNNLLLLFLILLAVPACATGELMCFESDAVDPAIKNEWTHHFYIFQVEPAISSHNQGTRFSVVHGVGYDAAPTPNGGTDLVPVSGAAAMDVDGTWVVSVNGTLHQQSLWEISPHPPYYVISEYWVLQPDIKTGTARIGNITTNFIERLLPGARDDYYEADLWAVPCETLR